MKQLCVNLEILKEVKLIFFFFFACDVAQMWAWARFFFLNYHICLCIFFNSVLQFLSLLLKIIHFLLNFCTVVIVLKMSV